MKKMSKRLIALLLCALMIGSNIPIQEVYAMEPSATKKEASNAEAEEAVSDGATKNKEAKKKIDGVNGQAGKEAISVSETDGQAGKEATPLSEAEEQEAEVTASEEAASTDTGEVQQTENTLLNYVFVEKSYVTTPDIQNIMADIGTENTVLESAILQYRNTETGQVFEVPAGNIDGNAVLFTIDHQEQETAEYELVGITYVVEGGTYSVNFADAGMDIKYGVNKEVESTPDEVAVSNEDCPEVEANVVTTDEEGQTLSEQDIQQALQNSESVVSALDGTINSARKSSNGNLVVVLDPGHDSTHAGTHAGGCSEEDLVLKIAQYCKAELEKYGGVIVYMTRDGKGCPNGGSSVDSTTCNAKRVEFAVSKNADVYVSFHLNSNNDPSANGAGVYYPNSNYRPDLGQEGKELAQKIFEKLHALGLSKWAGGTLIHNSEDNTLYPDGSLADYLGVIRRCKEAGIPAVLIEHAFQSNAGDVANFLSSDEKLQKLGIADATAIAEYYGLLQNSATVYNGVDYSAVYDYDYYSSHYSDVKSAFGNDKGAALQHFVNYGMKEGRQASAEFNVYTYKSRYADLRQIYGNDLPFYYLHYIQHGKAEGRVGNGTVEEGNVTYATVYNGVDYSAVYDFKYYTNRYNDIKKLYGNDDLGALAHFVNHGMKEGRQGKESFDVYSYRNQYRDLRNVYGKDLKSYYMHYIRSGQKEGRIATGVTTIQNALTVYNGVDYSAVYDFGYYTSRYGDIKKLYGDDDFGALVHFVNYGMKEGRQGKQNFDVYSYRNQYQDLRNVYGKDLKSYYLHYIRSGQKEGRIATGVTTLQNGITVYNGVNYSAVYDFGYYTSRYGDIKKLYGDDELGALLHFINYGMKEGRQGKESFDVYSYRNQYKDLRRAYGNDLKSYYLHYIRSGQKEGRIAAGVTSMQNYETIYNGVNYAAVYDYNYYINAYSDIKNVFGGDEAAVLKHFVNHGMKEGRQGSQEFNVYYYKENYLDLAAAYGNDLASYYLHYIKYGKAEGRTGAQEVNYSIMGSSNTSLSQMVAYYNANKTYPAFYQNTEAPTIEAFCQIYLEECAAEGVKAEVAFCQAMKETGFLQFGGKVKIEQYNFAGIGATDSGDIPATFSGVREGIRAQVQHLKAYASKETLKNTCVDPRFHLVARETAPYVEWLGINENPHGMGWASAVNYGYSIKNDYITKLLKY